MGKTSRLVFFHTAGCLTFLALPILLAPRPPEMPVFSLPTLRDFLANVFMLLIFYLNYYFFIPTLYFRKNYLPYAIAIAAGFLIIAYLPSLLTGYIPWDPPEPPRLPPEMPMGAQISDIPASTEISFFVQVQHNILLYVVVILFSLLLKVRTRLYQTEIQRHNAEISSLKNQINPHFLFNTLNNLYAQATREKSLTTAAGIIKLSGMMRYVVTESEKKFVSLEKEISYVDSYIELQKMRLTENTDVHYRVSGQPGHQQIAPLVLIPFIENAFKHGVNPDYPSQITIAIDISENMLQMKVENEKSRQRPDLMAQSGIGIENTKARLQLLYPERHRLTMHDEPNHFLVNLTLQLS